MFFIIIIIKNNINYYFLILNFQIILFNIIFNNKIIEKILY